jgi:periplasmic divalent cation tolerance protein
MILVYVTCRDRAEAERIAEHLLKKRLIACANMFPIESMYWWKGKITGDNEFAILGKTIEEKFPEIKKEVKKIHSYEVPCIIKWSAEADEGFLAWLTKEVL